MTRKQKEAEIIALGERFANDEVVVVAEYSGLTVKELEAFRGLLRAEGASFKVTKNTLAKIAIKGTKFEAIEDMFSGPIGIATSQDPVAAARVTQKFAKGNENLKIIGGALGEKALDAQGIEALAKMPSLDEVRATIAGLIMAPASNIASAIASPGSKVAGAVKAVGEKAEA
ncbi:MAG: 50S ribosomal protein L10 [Alphaproteobacteria bacterium]|nr:50S ribosomal protein L10 [Alphaproteobacteria bacterium]